MNISNLPPSALRRDRWRRHYLPTVIRYFGTLDNPWNVDDEDDLKRVLMLIWEAVYGSLAKEMPYTDNVHSVVRALVSVLFYLEVPPVNIKC